MTLGSLFVDFEAIGKRLNFNEFSMISGDAQILSRARVEGKQWATGALRTTADSNQLTTADCRP